MATHLFGALRIEVREDSGVLRVDWHGKSNMAYPESSLTPLLRQVTADAAKAGLRLELHFETLEFFNSSTITTVIRHIKNLPTGLPVDVFYSEGHAWQKIFFDALWFFERSNKLFRVRATK